MKNRILVMSLVAVLMLSSVALGCPPPPPVVPVPVPPVVHEWLFLGEHPAGGIYDLMMRDIAERIYIASGGRLDITITAGGEIVPAYAIMTALKEGVGQMAWGNMAMHRPFIGDVGFLLTPTGLPGGPHPIELIAWYYHGGGAELVNEIIEPWGVSVGVIPSQAEVFAHSAMPLISAACFEGIKFRTMGLWADMLAEHFGAAVVVIPGGEIYAAAAAGIIDAFEFISPWGNWPMGFHEITAYMGYPGIHSPSWLSYMVVCHDAWAALPLDLRQILKGEIRASVIDFIIMWHDDGVAMEKFVDFGIELFGLCIEFQKEIAKLSAKMVMEMAAACEVFATVLESQRAFFEVFRAGLIMQPEVTLFEFLD